MSAPTVERTRRAAARGATAPAARGTNAQGAGVPAQRTGSGAVGRAYARRAGRERRATEPTDPAAAGRPRFVLMVMGLLGAGLVASLWLSTSAAADSYRLEEATRAARDLSERSESLRTEIAALRSAPALAQAARDLGMVPVSDVARLVAQPDGSVAVVGTPRAGVAPPPPMPPALPEGVLPPGTVPGQQGAVPGQSGAGQQGAVPRQATGAQQAVQRQPPAGQPVPVRRQPAPLAAGAPN